MTLTASGRPLRTLIALAFALLSLSVAVASASAAVAQRHHKHHRHHVRHVVPKPTIAPGGDRDADNNGAPSDGDGGI